MTRPAVIIVPARYPSVRFPGKPLAVLTGATGVARSLIHRSWAAACQVRGVDAVYVATDDDRIAEAARGFGADVLMTSAECRNGTERCAEALRLLPATPDIVVNVQGDAPLTPPDYVEALIAAMSGMDAPDGVAVATPVLETSGAHLARLRADRAEGRVGGTTAVRATDGNALYFSKEVIPFTGRDYAADEITPVLHHVGVYAYTPEALTRYAALPVGPLETLEGLEQLRFLEAGFPVRCVEVAARGRAFWELNNPGDIPIIEEIMRREGIE
jgi:3-deoxy-manno-octulosonate cytidylyltransferase (CMP-KDO synthetase)